MSLRSALAFVVIFSTLSFAQKRQPNKPSEPSVKPTPTGEQVQEETFPAEAGKVAPAAPETPKSSFEGMKYRLVGPFRGGRVVAVAGVPGEANVYYFGGASGGMWKTTDGGLNWKPLGQVPGGVAVGGRDRDRSIGPECDLCGNR